MTVWLIRAHTSCDTLNIFFQISVKCGRVQVGILYHLPLSIVSISSVRSGRKKERTLLRQRRSLSPERIGSALRLLSLGTRSGVVIFSIRLLGTPAEGWWRAQHQGKMMMMIRRFVGKWVWVTVRALGLVCNVLIDQITSQDDNLDGTASDTER